MVRRKIDEEILKGLFGEGKKRGGGNGWMGIVVGMCVLKEGLGWREEDVFEKWELEVVRRKGVGMEVVSDVRG